VNVGATRADQPTREEKIAAIEVELRRRRHKIAAITIVVVLAIGALGYGMVRVLLLPMDSYPPGRHSAVLSWGSCTAPVVEYGGRVWWSRQLVPGGLKLPVKGTLVILRSTNSDASGDIGRTARFDFQGRSIDLTGGAFGAGC
jgi:hypothetical protein